MIYRTRSALLWMILLAFTSSCNDMLTKVLSGAIPPVQIIFMRSLFAILMLLPLYYKIYATKPIVRQSPFLYCVRGVILLSAMLLWSNAIKEQPLALTTTMALLLPIFVIIFARIFLQEKISRYCLISMVVGFLGSTIISVHEFYHEELYIIDFYYARSLFWLVFSIILFALSDVINKKYSPVETPVYTMFCIVLYATLFSAPFAYYTWTDPRPTDLLIAALLGFGSNASFFCILKAISISTISNLGPLRYIELIFSSLFGFMLFSEIPPQNFYFGCALIIVSNWIVTVNRRDISTT